jgi:hypothetical protein
MCVCVCRYLYTIRLSNFCYLLVHRCLSHLPRAVGKNPAHFDLSLARKQALNRQLSSGWLVLHVQELISLAYQVLNMNSLPYYYVSFKKPQALKRMLKLTFFGISLVSDKHNTV